MKNFQQNLLIVVALALCVLCVYQWYGQAAQRTELRTLEGLADQKSAAIQGYTNSIHNMDAQIAQMDVRLTELKAQAKTNADLIVGQRREINRLEITSEGLTNTLTEYKTAVAEYKRAVTNLETRLTEAYAGIEKQNQAIKEVAAQRDEYVKKYNDSVKDRNDVVNKYNDLVRQVEKNPSSAK